jgi:hypothetical protein
MTKKTFKGVVENSKGEKSERKVTVLGPTYLYGISQNKGKKASYSFHFEQEIEIEQNKRDAIFKGSGLALKNSTRKTAIQSFTAERFGELGLDEYITLVDDAGGEVVNLKEKIDATTIFNVEEVNISISETTEEPYAGAEAKRAGEDGEELLIGDMNIYVERVLVAGEPTFEFLQHDPIKRTSGSF